MTIWSSEIKELEKLIEPIKGKFPGIEKELKQLINTQDANVAMLYARRCLEIIVTDLCEKELKRPRKTEPLKGIIDKLNSEEKVPSYIITSMQGLNSLSTYGAHPRDFDPAQVKPVLNNLSIVLKWYLNYIESQTTESIKDDTSTPEFTNALIDKKEIGKPKKKITALLTTLLLVIIVGTVVTIIFIIKKQNGNYSNLEKSIAILPFRNDSHDDSTQYFMNGVMEELLMNLQKIKELRVLGRTSVEQYRSQNKTIRQIAKELGVNYIIEGSGQKSGNSLRMRVQLIRTNKESHIWANNFEQDNLNIRDYFQIQAGFAMSIAKELKAVITPVEKQLLEKVPTKRIEAYEAYLQGMAYWRKLSKNDLETAMKYFELAKVYDPEFALAYAGIGFVWISEAQMGYVSATEAGPRGNTALTTALKLDSTLDQIHYMNACAKTWSEWDWKSGESEFRKTLAINPNHSDARAYYSHFLNIMGRPGEAMEQIDIALKLDPVSPLIKALYSGDLLFAHRYVDAVAVSGEALTMEPTNPVALWNLAYALNNTEKYKEALEVLKMLYETGYPAAAHVFKQGNGSTKKSYLRVLRDEADTLAKQSKNLFFNPMDIALLYGLAGDKENAITWIEEGYIKRDQGMPYLSLYCFGNLCSDPRVLDIFHKMNLPY